MLPVPTGEDRPLTVPLLVSPPLASGWLALFALLALVLRVVTLEPRPPILSSALGDAFLVLGVFAALLAFVGAAWSRLDRRWLTVTLTGFVVIGRWRRWAVSDEQVLALAEDWRLDREKRWRLRLVLETSVPGARRLVLVHRAALGQPHPLAPLAERLTQRLAGRARAEMPRGGRLAGDGWELSAAGLSVRRLGRTWELKDLARASCHGEQVCVWEQGQVRPSVRVPLRSRNARALALVLRELAREDPARPVSHPLGRLLLERRSTDVVTGL